MTLKEALALCPGERVYAKKYAAFFTVAYVRRDLKGAAIVLADGREIPHREAQLPEKMLAVQAGKAIQKNRKDSLMTSLSLDAARALVSGDMVYCKSKNSCLRVENVRFCSVGGVESVGIALSDGSVVPSDDLMLAPANAKEGPLPF